MMWFRIVFLLEFCHLGESYYEDRFSFVGPIAILHDPYYYGGYYLPLEIDDQVIPAPWNQSPDFRLPEPPWTSLFAKNEAYNVPRLQYLEWNRPYRLTPPGKRLAQTMKYSWMWYRPWEQVNRLACVCVTAYKRLTPLAICTILTCKHLLTTATATELVLRRHPKKNTLENILGAWYHVADECDNPRSQNCFNGSTYMTPSRIHYHYRWVPPDRTNRSHPLPTTMDIALWVSTYPFNSCGQYLWICPRGISIARYYHSPTIYYDGLYMIVGSQFVWDLHRLPMPWFTYAVKVRATHEVIDPCPKVEWGWFFCVQSRSWAQLGLDSGAAMIFSSEELGRTNEWRQTGLVGINALSMKLRSFSMVHYFTPVDIHPVLDWLYSAYNGRLIYRFLDSRFNDTQWGTPKPKPWAKIVWGYVWAEHENYWTEDTFYPHWMPWH